MDPDRDSASATASRLSTWDYASMSVVVLLASSVGIYHVFASRRSKNAREFLITSRELGVLPLVLSAVASYVSGVGILGFPSESYKNGVVFVGVILQPLLCAVPAAYLYLTVFYNLGSATIFEYLEFRFNRFMRTSSSIILSVQLLLYTSCVIYAPALALQQVTGLNLWLSVISIGVVCIMYTSMGGLKAVVWADVIQIFVMVSVLFVILCKGVLDAGGLSTVWRLASEGKRSAFFIFTSSPDSAYTSWTILIGGTFHFLGTLVMSQLMMQRFLSNDTLKKARISLYGTCVGVFALTAVTSFSGLVIYARYHDRDPLLAGKMTSRDQLMALFGIETLSFCDGLPGIFVGALLCATLSTLSSTLNALTACAIEDYVRPCCPQITDGTVMVLSKILGVVFGVICVALVALAESMGGIAKAVFSIMGVTNGPVLGLFTVGMLLPWVDTLGAASGFYVSLIFTSWACVGNLITKPILPSAPVSCRSCDNGRTSSEGDYLFNGNATHRIGQFFNGSQSVATSGVAEALFGDNGLAAADPNGSGSGFPLYSMSPFWYSMCGVFISILVSVVVSLIFGTKNPSDFDPKLISPITRKICTLLPVPIRRKLGYGPTNKTMALLEMRYSEVPLKLAGTADDFTRWQVKGSHQLNG